MMTPDPDPDWVSEGLAGMPRVRMLTTEGRIFATTAGTDNVLSEEVIAAPSGAAKANEVAVRLTNRVERAKERSTPSGVPRTIGLIFEIGLIFAQLSLKKKPQHKTQRGEDRSSPRSSHLIVLKNSLLNGGEHFLNCGRLQLF